MKVPKKIKVGAYDYEVKLVKGLVYEYRLLGQSLPDAQIIKVDEDANLPTRSVTLWHEIVHSISDVYNCDLDEPNIDRLAQGIASILQDSFGIKFEWD